MVVSDCRHYFNCLTVYFVGQSVSVGVVSSQVCHAQH